MPESHRLAGKRCLVTGGSRGLGFALCKAFATEGARVAFTFSSDRQCAETALLELQGMALEAHMFQGSVADSEHVQQVVEALNSSWDGIDILVNNAGPTQVLPVALIEEADFDYVMNTNVKGAFLFSRAVLKSMIRSRSGHIINIGSFASERIVEAPIHYAAAKAALRGLTEALAREVGRYNIQVNLLAPGLMDSGLSRMLPRHRVDEYLAQCPAGRMASVDEVAKFTTFLVSDENSFITGAKIGIDAGV